MYSFNNFIAYTLIVILGTVWSGTAQPFEKQADQLPRIAVLCEQKNNDLLSMAEQIEVDFSQRNDLIVLDRANIDRALKEQELVANQSRNMDSYIQIGKFLRSDLLIVVDKKKDYVVWRFIDVHEGILAGLHVTAWPTEKYSTALSDIEEAIKRAIGKTRQSHNANMQYLAFVRFLNQDISRQHDSLEEVLPVLISANLLTMPEIGVVERSRLNKVSDEKALTEGAETGYKSGTLIVKGEISIIRDKDLTSVSVNVSAEKPGKPAHIRFTCVTPLQNIDELAQNISHQLLETLKDNNEIMQTAHASEAETYFLKGRLYAAQKNDLIAISLFKTACLLMPTNTTYQSACRSIRRNIIGNRGFPQELRLRYYIEDMDDWKTRFYSAQISSKDILQYEGWHNTDCIALEKPTNENPAEQWQIAYDGYRTLLGPMLDYCKTNNIRPSYMFEHRLWSNLLKDNFFKDPLDVCMLLKKYIDSKYLYIDLGHYRQMTPTLDYYYSDFQTFAKQHTLSGEQPQKKLDDYARVIFNNLAQDDSPPLIRVWSKLALIKTGLEKELYASDTLSEAGQSIVNELAFWELDSLPCGHPYHDCGTSVMNDLLMYLIRNDKRDIMPAIGSIRKALKEPDASYTQALDAFAHQIYRYSTLTENLSNSANPTKLVTTQYHEWADIFCQYLNYQMRMGRKDNAIKLADAVSRSEKMSGSPREAADCMAQITHIFSLYGHHYKYDVSETTKATPLVVAQKSPPAKTQYAKVAWHLDKEEIPNGHKFFKDHVVIHEDTILYYDYVHPDTRRGYFEVTCIDLATGRILQPPFYQESLRHSDDPDLGISKKEICSWCEMDGQCYVGCVGGFGVYSEGVFKMIASSRKEEMRQPLDGGSSYTVASIRPDASKKKLYLLIQGEAARTGVWEYTPETGEQKLLINIAGGIDEGMRNIRWDDTHMYVSGTFYTLAFNTQSPDESFVIAKDYSNRSLSNIKCWQERGLRDIRVLEKDSQVFLAGGWSAHAVMGPHTIYTQKEGLRYNKANYIWKTGENQPRRLILLDKSGEPVTSTSWSGSLSVAQWTATPHGFFYQLNGGGIGLFSNVESFLECEPSTTSKQDVPANTKISGRNRVPKWPPENLQRMPVTWHLDAKQICKSDSIYAERTQLIITNDTLRYVSNVCRGGVKFIKSHAFNVDMITGRIISSETSTNNLFVPRNNRPFSDLDAQCQRLGLKEYTRSKGPYNPVIEPDGRHIIASFNEGMLICDTLSPEKTCWIMDKSCYGNPPPSISNILWLDTDLNFSTLAVSSGLMLFSKKSSTYVWYSKATAPCQLVLLGKDGHEVSPQDIRNKEYYKWVAVQQGFLYQLADGSIGLVKNL